MNNWLVGLNPEQKEAAMHVGGPLLILAGAGSGKTTVLISRTGYLIDEAKIRASEICVLTFTNKAARELQHRVHAKLGKQKSKGLWAGTFHSFGLQFLRQYYKEAGLPKHFGIIDSSDATQIAKELLRELRAGKEGYDVEKLLAIIANWRAMGLKSARRDDEYEIAAEWLMPKYLQKLKNLGVVDFDDLLLKPLQILREHTEIKQKMHDKYRYLMVDEFQDTNKVQMKLLGELIGAEQNIAVVGDDDQSIYGFRGAEVANILQFPQLFKNCKVVKLERNYRSTPAILELANHVIAHNTHRHGKVLKPNPEADKGILPEVFVYESEEEEAEQVINEIQNFTKQGRKLDEIAILYRANSQGALIEAYLRKMRIAYSMSGGTAFFDRKEIKDILAYLRCAILPNEVSFRRIINTPSRGIGEHTIELITQESEKRGVSFYQTSLHYQALELHDKCKKGFHDLFQFLQGLSDRLLRSVSKTAGESLLEELTHLGYKKYIADTSKDHHMTQKRWALVEIFARVLDSYLEREGRTESGLRNFIDSMELRDQVEEDSKEPKLQLLTLHACKGLEYPICFLLGVEEDLLPHKTLGEDIHEERRLFYVGITRAKERLILTRSNQRKKYGRLQKSMPSRFLLEIEPKYITTFERGARPVSEDSRKDMLASFFSKYSVANPVK